MMARSGSARGRALACLAVVLAGALLVRSAAAADSPVSTGESAEALDPGELGVVAGAATLLLGSLTGGLLLARASSTTVRNAGVTVAGFGFAAAPMAAHVATGELARGVAFSAVPLALAGADLGLVEGDPTLIDEEGTVKTRVPFALVFTLGLTSGVIGVVDAMFATARRDRAHARPLALRDLHVVPVVARDGGSLGVGGTF